MAAILFVHLLPMPLTTKPFTLVPIFTNAIIFAIAITIAFVKTLALFARDLARPGALPPSASFIFRFLIYRFYDYERLSKQSRPSLSSEFASYFSLRALQPQGSILFVNVPLDFESSVEPFPCSTARLQQRTFDAQS